MSSLLDIALKLFFFLMMPFFLLSQQVCTLQRTRRSFHIETFKHSVTLTHQGLNWSLTNSWSLIWISLSLPRNARKRDLSLVRTTFAIFNVHIHNYSNHFPQSPCFFLYRLCVVLWFWQLNSSFHWHWCFPFSQKSWAMRINNRPSTRSNCQFKV